MYARNDNIANSFSRSNSPDTLKTLEIDISAAEQYNITAVLQIWAWELLMWEIISRLWKPHCNLIDGSLWFSYPFSEIVQWNLEVTVWTSLTA